MSPPTSDFEIWSSPKGVHVVESPVRRKILWALREEPRSLTHLVRATGKAKSTLSAVHMPPLIEAGLVVEKRDPRDTRVVLFHLRGRPVTSSSHAQQAVGSAVGEELATLQGASFLGPWDLVDPGRAFDERDWESLRRHLARQVARAWAASLSSSRLPALLRELGARLEAAGAFRLANVTPKGTSFRIAGPISEAEVGFLRLVLEALILEKAAVAARIVPDGALQFRVVLAGDAPD